MIKKKNKDLIATGGTGGHVFPAYGLAKHLTDKRFHVEIISDERGIKYLKKFNDVKISVINTSSVYNKNFIQKFISSLVIIHAILKSFIFLIINRPNLVFGMGGYSSFPICVVAKLLNIPFIIYENNLHVGKANKFLLPFNIMFQVRFICPVLQPQFILQQNLFQLWYVQSFVVVFFVFDGGKKYVISKNI